MNQDITIKIGNKPFAVKVSSPDEEELIRKAASVIERKVAAYTQRYPDKSLQDLLSFVCLNECVTALSLKARLEALTKEHTRLSEDLAAYLDDAGNI